MPPGLVLSFLLVAPGAHAESATLMQKGAAVVYAGPGVTTYSQLNTGDTGGTDAEREVSHALQGRLDLFGGWQPWERLAFYAYVPVVYSTVVESEVTSPCAGPTGNCEPVVGIGSAALQGRFALVRSPLSLTIGLGVSSGAWNEDVRRRYTMVGEASTDILPALYAGWSGGGGSWRYGVMVWGVYAARFPTYDQSDLAEKAPADDVRAGLELKGGRGPVELTLGTTTLQRLGGTDFYAYGESDDVWATVDYDAISVTGKVSLSLPAQMGIHLGVNRTVWVHNGPVDATDVSIGVHKYFPPG